MSGRWVTVVALSSPLLAACVGSSGAESTSEAPSEAGDAAAGSVAAEPSRSTAMDLGGSASPGAHDKMNPHAMPDGSVSPAAEPARADGGGAILPSADGVSMSVDAGSSGSSTSDGGQDAPALDVVTNDAGSSGVTLCEPNAMRCSDDTPEVCDASQTWRQLLACEAPMRCLAGECKQPLANPCPLVATLSRFQGDSHVVDGDGSEFVGVEPVTYALSDAPVVSASYAADLPTMVTLRLAWTPSAFVAHAHVEDPAIQIYEGSTLEYYWQGDNVQFFIAPTDVLTGTYSGTEDGGATHLIIVPPTETQPARGLEVYEPCYACVDASLSTVSYAARLVDDGYEVELSWPWSSPHGVFTAGDRVALNVIVGAGDSPGGGLELEGLLANNPVDGETTCGGATHPGCDDRTWCYAVLE